MQKNVGSLTDVFYILIVGTGSQFFGRLSYKHGGESLSYAFSNALTNLKRTFIC